MRYILIAEDEPSLRFVYSEALRDAGFEVTAVENGAECMRELECRLPSLLMLDLRMPGLTGAGIVEALRSDPRTERLPILVVTGSVNADLFPPREQVQGVLLKPFDVDHLVGAVKRLLS